MSTTIAVCAVCGGTYDTVLPDGTNYYHACPPLSLSELRAQPALIPKTIAARCDALDAVASSLLINAPLKPSDVLLLSLSIARPNARNENPQPQAKGASV